jgi:diamine N-acetyltransferase
LQTKSSAVRYISGNEELLDKIEPLWTLLNQQHLRLSKHFKNYYLDMTFQKRKITLLKKAQDGKLRVDIANADQPVGYCVSSINTQKEGVIESLFVDKNYRLTGIGDALIRKAIDWLDNEGATSKIVEVSVGNEEAFGFYERYGFLPRKTMLKQVK